LAAPCALVRPCFCASLRLFCAPPAIMSRRPILPALLILSALIGWARADVPIFPPGSRVGLVPPQGFEVGKAFSGFGDPARNALILITELPASAYAELDARLADEQLQRQGVTAG